MLKLLRIEVTKIFHPSMATNKTSLNGSEMRTGGSRSRPNDIRILAMIKSSIKNGI